MMKAYLICAFATLATQTAFATTAKDVKDKTAAAADSAVEYTKEQKDAFVSDMEQKLASLKKELHELEVKADKTKNEQIKALEKRQKELEADLRKLKASSGQAWSKLRAGLSKAWDQMADSFSEAKKELQK